MGRFNQAIQELGDSIQLRWQKEAFDDNRLPPIAVAELERYGVHQFAELPEITELVFQTNAATHVPVNESFGDAAVCIYRAPRFFIEALLWTDGTTTIHQHGFSGAFMVLCGGSFHGQYRFDVHERVNAAMTLGGLQLVRSELLRHGDIRPIEAGSRFIHNLFHLEAPSITLVVRTYGNRGVEPQFDYLPPGLGVDPFFRDPVHTHQTRYMKMLLSLEHPTAERTLRDHIVRADLHTAYRTLETLRDLLVGKKLWEPAMGWVRDRHPQSIEWLEGAFEEIARRQYIVDRRRLIQDPDIRFFMAMLLNAPSLAEIRGLTRTRFPGVNPDEQLVKWIAKILDAHDAEYEEGNLAIIRFALESPTDDHVISRLREAYDENDVNAQLPMISALCEDLRENHMFKRLLQV
jgi:hypothetical protein